MKSFLDPLLQAGSALLVLTNARHGGTVARTVLTAFDSASRRRGLLRHDFLPESTALVIAPSNAIHTFSMRFAIDAAFVARDGRVVKIRRDMPPRRIAAAWRAYAVVELAAGELARSDTEVGDVLRVG
jgi:uncharacterized membrane protein (UPF0127 family)